MDTHTTDKSERDPRGDYCKSGWKKRLLNNYCVTAQFVFIIRILDTYVRIPPNHVVM